MTRRARRTVFYLLLGVFLILGTGAVLYAEGWRMDFRSFRPLKVGAIFVRSFPVDASISLDGEPVPNRAGILSHGTLISDLFPGQYDLALRAAGYRPWNESVTVAPSSVTELKYAVLVPETPNTAATSSVKNFAVIGNEIVTETQSGAIRWQGTTVAYGDIADHGDDESTLLIKNPITGAYALYDLSAETSTDLSPAFATENINPDLASRISIDPYDAAKVVVALPRRIALFDAARGTATVIGAASDGLVEGPDFAVAPASVAWTETNVATGTSSLIIYDKFAQAVRTIVGTPQGTNRELAWIGNSMLGVLQSDGSLFLYDPNAQTFQKLADDVKYFAPTDDGSALAALENKSFEVFSFTDALAYHRFSIPDVHRAMRVIWYRDGNHLFVEYPDRIAFLDLDDSTLRNFLTVSQGVSPLYKPSQNVLYLKSADRKLLEFAFPG